MAHFWTNDALKTYLRFKMLNVITILSNLDIDLTYTLDRAQHDRRHSHSGLKINEWHSPGGAARNVVPTN